MNLVRSLLVVCAVAAASGPYVLEAQNSPLTTLKSTGFTSSGALQAAGLVDANYTVLETGTAVVLSGSRNFYMFANDANSQWIWGHDNAAEQNVTRNFRTTFDLTGFDPLTAQITGLWGVDNTGEIFLNSISTGITLPNLHHNNYVMLHGFSISSGFVDGINTLDFRVGQTNGGAGFRAELSGTADALPPTAAPEPATLVLVGTGMFALFITHRRRNRAS